MQNLRLHEESRKIQMENSQIMMQTQQTTNMLLVAFMKMNLDLLQALSTATLSPPLMLGSVAFGSLLTGSSTREEEAAQPTQREAGDPILPSVVPSAIEDDTPMSSTMHLASTKVERAKAASVVPESSTNLEINALEIGRRSDELGFSDAGASSDT